MSPDPARSPLPTVVVGLVIAFCAVLLLKWLALVAVVALVVALGVRWAWARPDRPRSPLLPPLSLPVPRPPAGPRVPAAPVAEDCSWCGRPGGHVGPDGERIRPRHAHATAGRRAG